MAIALHNGHAAAHELLDARRDLLDIFALAGDDTIDVDSAITIGGSIDGGPGSDLATAAASWTILNSGP